MTTTLLVVEDSATMRKALEITFSGEDFEVVAVESGAEGVKRASAAGAALALVDVSLPGADGYGVCKQLKAENPSLLVVLMSAKQVPYDVAKGSAAGADDHVEKPFDTQQLIDRVRKVLTSKTETASPPPPRPAQPAEAKLGGTLPGAASPPAAPPPRAPAASAPRVVAPAGPPPRAHAPSTPVVVPVPPASRPPIVAAAVSAMGDKLSGLGLSSAQAEAVMALSREVVERVVWEVVPVLAETIIKEELSRLTRDA